MKTSLIISFWTYGLNITVKWSILW